MFTIKTKIIAAITVVVGCMFFVFGVFIYQQVKSANLEKVDVRLESLAQKIRDEIDEQFEKQEFPKVEKLQNIVTEILPLSVFRVCDSSGVTICGDSILLKAKLYSLKEIQSKKQFIEKIRIDHKRYRSLWHPVEIEDHHEWVLQAAAPLSGVEENLDQLELVLWTTIPFALIITALAVYVIVRRALNPLSTMITTANRVSASNLNERLMLPHNHDEVAVLGTALNRMIERLEAAFKNQKHFIADASHEIRTPLTIIQSELEFADRSSMANSAKQSIHIALDELDHLRQLAGNLLLLARLEISDTIPHFQLMRLDELIADCVRKLSRMSVEKNVALQLHIENAIELLADEEKLRSAFLNLIENAIKYTPADGNISIVLKTGIEVVRIEIHDTGVGISPDDIQNIFKPFYRSDTSRATHSGSGLGLSIVQRIIELHHGTISVESIVNQGSTFNITLPLKQSGETN
jgi:signal transduction histidine kinase